MSELNCQTMSRWMRFFVCCLIALALPMQGWAAHADCGKAQMPMQAQAAMADAQHEDCPAHHAGKAAKMSADKCGSGACCCHAVAMTHTELLIEPQAAAPVAVPTVPAAHASVPPAGIEKPPRAELA